MKLDEIKDLKKYTRGEEIANASTHGLGVLLSLAGSVILIIKAAQQYEILYLISFSVFGIALFLLYSTSTLYHIVPPSPTKKILKILDHSAIFLLIAGTYTPFLLIVIGGSFGWIMFGTIWFIAISGILMKTLFFAKFQKLSLLLYILMGWMVVFASGELLENINELSLLLLAIGGFCYTFGVIFYVWRKLPYNHAVWHLFVLGGSISHYFSVLNII